LLSTIEVNIIYLQIANGEKVIDGFEWNNEKAKLNLKKTWYFF